MITSNGTFSMLLALCSRNSPALGNSPHKGQWRGALMFSLNWAWINGGVKKREAGDLRPHLPHYDAIVMIHAGITANLYERGPCKKKKKSQKDASASPTSYGVLEYSIVTTWFSIIGHCTKNNNDIQRKIVTLFFNILEKILFNL